MGPAGERPRRVPPAPLHLVARVVAIVTDLMLSSRVVESLGAAGHEVVVSGSPGEAELEGVTADGVLDRVLASVAVPR